MIFKHIKRSLVLGLILSQVLIGTAFANSNGTVNNTHVNVRSEANTSSKVMGQKNTGDKVSIIAKEGDWYKIQYADGVVGYIFGKYVTEEVVPAKVATPVATPQTPAKDTTPIVNQPATTVDAVEENVSIEAPDALLSEQVQLVVNTEVLNMRSSADLSSKTNIIRKLRGGERLTVIADAGEWYQVKTTDGTNGFVFKEYVKVYKAPIVSANEAELRQNIVDFAMNYIGLPYRSGGTSLTKGADCSGFTTAIMREFGIQLSRASYSQASNGVAVDYADLQKGDLVFYGYSGSISHVGIYIGDGKIIHETVPGKGVEVDYAGAVGSKRVVACRNVISR